MPTMTEITCRFCGKTRTVLKKNADRYSTCGAPECVQQRRFEGGSQSKGVAADNPNYSTGQWVRTEKLCLVCGSAFTGPFRRKFCSPKCAAAQKAIDQKGKPFPTTKRSNAPKSEAVKAAMSARIKGERNHMWLKTPQESRAKRDRGSHFHHEWRNAVLTRDNRTCQKCGKTTRLVAHHIKEWPDHPDLRYVVSNGLTLCISCHLRTHQENLIS